MFSICERTKLFTGAAPAVKIVLSLISELNFSQFPFTSLGNLVTVTAGERLEKNRFCCPTEPFIKVQQSNKGELMFQWKNPFDKKNHVLCQSRRNMSKCLRITITLK